MKSICKTSKSKILPVVAVVVTAIKRLKLHFQRDNASYI